MNLLTPVVALWQPLVVVLCWESGPETDHLLTQGAKMRLKCNLLRKKLKRPPQASRLRLDVWDVCLGYKRKTVW